MKKSLLGLLLAVALVVPAFAAKGDMSINGKLGLGVSNNIYLYDIIIPTKDAYVGNKMDMPVSLGAEFFYEAIDNLPIGVGFNYTFKTESKDIMSAKVKMGPTNVYLAVKPEMKIDSKIFTSIYAVGQIGLSMLGDMDISDESFSTDSGLYLGFGTGVTIANQVLVELICSSSNGSVSMEGNSVDLQYTAVTLNVGYKFAL